MLLGLQKYAACVVCERGWARAQCRPGRRRSIRRLNGEGGRGLPFTCPRGWLNGRPHSVLAPPPARPPRPRLHRVSSHATLFQICPLNRLAAIQFAVLKVIKLGEHAPESPHGTMLITRRPRSLLRAGDRARPTPAARAHQPSSRFIEPDPSSTNNLLLHTSSIQQSFGPCQLKDLYLSLNQ